MKKIQSLEDLQRFQAKVREARSRKESRGAIEVIVSLGSCGMAAGALEVLQTIEDEIKAHDLQEVTVSRTGCIGLCSHEPLLQVIVGDTSKVMYGRLNPAAVKRIFQEHILAGEIVEEHIVDATFFPTI